MHITLKWVLDQISAIFGQWNTGNTRKNVSTGVAGQARQTQLKSQARFRTRLPSDHTFSMLDKSLKTVTNVASDVT